MIEFDDIRWQSIIISKWRTGTFLPAILPNFKQYTAHLKKGRNTG